MIQKHHLKAPTGAATFLITAGINLANLEIDPIASSLAIYSSLALMIPFGLLLLIRYMKQQ